MCILSRVWRGHAARAQVLTALCAYRPCAGARRPPLPLHEPLPLGPAGGGGGGGGAGGGGGGGGGGPLLDALRGCAQALRWASTKVQEVFVPKLERSMVQLLVGLAAEAVVASKAPLGLADGGGGGGGKLDAADETERGFGYVGALDASLYRAGRPTRESHAAPPREDGDVDVDELVAGLEPGHSEA